MRYVVINNNIYFWLQMTKKLSHIIFGTIIYHLMLCFIVADVSHHPILFYSLSKFNFQNIDLSYQYRATNICNCFYRSQIHFFSKVTFNITDNYLGFYWHIFHATYYFSHRDRCVIINSEVARPVFAMELFNLNDFTGCQLTLYLWIGFQTCFSNKTWIST